MTIVIGGKTVLAVIAARGGSKGLPGKNLADLGGRPVVAWSVAAGKGSRHVDRLILSSDDRAIIAAARHAGCETPFKRPARLATDKASIYEVLLHALDAMDESYDYVVLLQATSPLRTARDIDACIELCRRSGAPAVVSVSLAAKPPQWMYELDAKGRLRPILKGRSAAGLFKTRRSAGRRQELPPVYHPNGAVYVARVDWLRKRRVFVGPGTRAYVMPTERSVDIDTRADLLLARALVADSSKKKETLRRGGSLNPARKR